MKDRSSPVQDGSGNLDKTTEMISEATKEWAQTKDFLEGILQSSLTVSIVLTDFDQNVLFWNKGAENIFGYAAEEMIGTKITRLYQDDGITAETFTDKDIVYQIGIAPVRVDVLTQITGVDFADAWGKRVPGTFFGVPVHFISRDDLETNKRALGRASDLEDLKRSSSQ